MPRQPHQLCTSRYPHLGWLPLHTQPHICVQQTAFSMAQFRYQQHKSRSPRFHGVWLSQLSQKHITLFPSVAQDYLDNKSQTWFILAVALSAQSAVLGLSSRSPPVLWCCAFLCPWKPYSTEYIGKGNMVLSLKALSYKTAYSSPAICKNTQGITYLYNINTCHFLPDPACVLQCSALVK